MFGNAVHRIAARHISARDGHLFHGSGAASYDRWTRRLFTPVYRRLARDVVRYATTLPLPADRPLRIADLGTGSGHLALEIARALPSSLPVEILGFDLSPDMIAHANQNAARLTASVAHRTPAPTIRFECVDVASLPLPDAALDLAVSSFSVHHWADLRRPIHELARVLRPGAAAWLYDVWNVRYDSRALQHAIAETPLAAAGIDSATVPLFGIPLITRVTLRR